MFREDDAEESESLLKRVSKEREHMVNNFFQENGNSSESMPSSKSSSDLDKEEEFFFKEDSQRNLKQMRNIPLMSLNSKDSYNDLLKARKWKAIMRKLFVIGTSYCFCRILYNSGDSIKMLFCE